VKCSRHQDGELAASALTRKFRRKLPPAAEKFFAASPVSAPPRGCVKTITRLYYGNLKSIVVNASRYCWSGEFSTCVYIDSFEHKFVHFALRELFPLPFVLAEPYISFMGAPEDTLGHRGKTLVQVSTGGLDAGQTESEHRCRDHVVCVPRRNRVRDGLVQLDCSNGRRENEVHLESRKARSPAPFCISEHLSGAAIRRLCA
jgi:hypothetical protein